MTEPAARVLFRIGWWRGLVFSTFSLRVVDSRARGKTEASGHISMRIRSSDKQTQDPITRVESACLLMAGHLFRYKRQTRGFPPIVHIPSESEAARTERAYDNRRVAMAISALEEWSDSRTPALAIVARGDQIRSLSPTRHEVRSQSRPGLKYEVRIRRDHWSCSCAYHRGKRRVCIHILAIRLRDGFAESTGDDAGASECPGCGSHEIIRFGKRHNVGGVVGRYLCNACGVRFTHRPGELRLRHHSRTVALALDLYFRGLSLRNVTEHLRQAYGIAIAPATIYGWIARFTPEAARWMDSLGPRTGEQWSIDETVVKTDGNPRWVWNVVDATTRFLLATHVTRLRRVRDARAVIRRAKKTSPDLPLEVRTDGMGAYRKAVGEELWFRSGGDVVNPHVRVPSIRAKKSNNLVERLNGTEKDRIKVMRGLHGRKGPKLLIEGLRVHYNTVRPHSALGTTPAVASGIPDLGGFRWQGLVEHSSRKIPAGQAEIVFVAG